MLKHLINFALIFILVGCASVARNPNSHRIEEVDWALSDIRVVVSNILPAGQRTMSPNGREIQSRHFVFDGKGGFKDAGDALDRYFAHVLILGDRRPYDVEILVTREKRVLRGNQFTYVVTGYDKRLAKELERKLRNELTQRREDRNIIDDFRVY